MNKITIFNCRDVSILIEHYTSKEDHIHSDKKRSYIFQETNKATKFPYLPSKFFIS